MILLRLYWEFFKTGLFAVGGGLATIPFLQDIARRTGWFDSTDLSTMIAVSESTPGPMGVNTATYVGFHTAGLPGAVIATLGLITPSILIILLIAGFLRKFRQSKTVDAVFSGLRPASTALITSAGIGVALSVLFTQGEAPAIRWPCVLLCAGVFLCMNLEKLRRLHPVVFIAAAAVIGAVFGL